jgi:hypothetical protein
METKIRRLWEYLLNSVGKCRFVGMPEANSTILAGLKSYMASKGVGGGWPDPAATQSQPAPVLLQIKDQRTKNPATLGPMSDNVRKSVNVDPAIVKGIIAHAKASGVDPYTALAISYQETGLNKDHPYDLNPDVYKTNYGDPAAGVKTIVSQMQYAKQMQQKGVVPQGEAYLLQGYNGYGKIKRGHADLEGATSIYGYPIPAGGLDLKANPLYGKTVISLRDEVLKNNADIKNLVDTTPAYTAPVITQ